VYQRTNEQYLALASVFRQPGGQVFWEMLLDMAKDHDRTARKLDGPALYRAQGAAEALEQLAKDMEAVVKNLRTEKLRALSSRPADPTAA
jgi:hypothetical protein